MFYVRKWLCIGLTLLFLLTAGCAFMPHGEESSTPTTVTTTTTTACTTTTTTANSALTSTTVTTTTPVFITEEQAVAIAEQHWGIHNGDVAPETGFMMTVGPMVLPTAETPEYIIALRWLVEDENGQVTHSSMLDRITINAYTGELEK